MSIKIKSYHSTAEANVDIYSALTISPPSVMSQSGYFIAVGEVDDGTVFSAKTQRSLYVTQDYRTSIGIDKIVWQDTFNHDILNTSKYLATAVTQTMNVSGGTLNLNYNNSLTSGAVSQLRTAKTFSLFNRFTLYADFNLKVTGVIQTDNTIEFGFGIVTGTTTSPSDGIFFRISNGVSGIIVNNSLETSCNNIFTPTTGASNHYLIVAGIDFAEFWVDDILRGRVYHPATTGGTINSNSLPIFFRNYNSSSLSSPTQLNVYQVGVSLSDMDSGKDWATTMVTNGQSSISAPDGQTAAQTANITNNLDAYTTPLLPGVDFTNTYTSGTTLGGQFAFSGVTSGETDYILFAYKNPSVSAITSGKNLIITNVEIQSFSSGATTIGATLFQWSLGVGGTDVSLLTVDSVTAGTRAARRITLGTQYLVTGSVNGTLFNRDIGIEFGSPLMVEPGTYLHVILKIPHIAPVNLGLYRGVVMINGYFE